MSELDETDVAILSLLAEDARMPFSQIGDEVGLSGPAVSDRVQRLQDAGVIERFTLELDRTLLRAGVPVFVRFEPPESGPATLRDQLEQADGVEHIFVTAEGEVWFYGQAPGPNVRTWLERLAGDEAAGSYEVTLVDEAAWTPSLEGTEFALTCAECSNTVDSEGVSERIGGEIHHFCCTSCRDRFRDTYEELAERA